MSDLGNKKTMANNIKKYMHIYNKSRIDICKDLNISYTTFSDWVNAKTYPRIDKIELLSKYFDIEKSDLVEDKELYRSKRKKSDYFGDYDDTIEYLKKDPDLLMLYRNIIENDTIAILFDKVQKLTPKEVEQILKIIDTFDKELD